MRSIHLALAVLVLGGTAMTATSDEGMWLLNAPPREQLQKKYQFDLTDAWVKHAMLASAVQKLRVPRLRRTLDPWRWLVR